MTSAVMTSLNAHRDARRSSRPVRNTVPAPARSGARVTAAGRESGQMLHDFKQNLSTKPVQAVRMTSPTPATAADPFISASSTTERFAVVDALGATVPAGFYALARTKASGSGNDITFFEVEKSKPVNGKPSRTYIKQLIGAPGQWNRETLRLHHQYFAYLHIAADLAAAGALFAEKAECCRRCGSPLTNKASRDRGYGSGCWSIIRKGE
jgi:hypothetical protein